MMKNKPAHLAQCRCGAVEVSAWSEPLVVTACYCDDCQAASERLAASSKSPPLAGPDGGTEFMVFRRDRIACTRGKASGVEACAIEHDVPSVDGCRRAVAEAATRFGRLDILVNNARVEQVYPRSRLTRRCGTASLTLISRALSSRLRLRRPG
jgi:NAD(P)-dependent dehydrogenase (short-subunit alcohol dehydrogenase family)